MNIRHSIIGKVAREAIHIAFRLKNPGSRPLSYKLANSLEIRLYPEGELAEILSFPRLFEFTEVKLVAAFLKPGMAVLDIGANIGLYSILAQPLVGRTGQIWAFEPLPETYERLLRNLALNSCESVQAMRLALSDEPETQLHLRSDPGYGDMYRYLATKPAEGADRNSEVVPVTTLDEHAKKAGIPPLDFIKVDVEGGEYRVFRGARQVLSGSPNVVIMFESEPDWCKRAGCRQQDTFGVLEDLGFGLYTWDRRAKAWDGEDRKLLNSQTIWACRDKAKLPLV